jgi:hypothetical protein
LFWFYPDGVFNRFNLAALRGCHTLNVCLFVCYQKQCQITSAILALFLVWEVTRPLNPL